MTEPDQGATTTQPRPNLSTEPAAPERAVPTTEQPRPNLSTEHQQTGDARRPTDTLDRGQPDRSGEAPGAPARKTSLTGDEPSA